MLHNKLHPKLDLKFMISRILWVRNQSRSGLSRSSSSGPLRWLCRQGLHSFWGSTWEDLLPDLLCGRIQFHVGFWLEASFSPLLHVGLSIGQFPTWRLASIRANEWEIKWEDYLSFYKLTSEVTSHHFCCMLLIKS